MDTSANSSSANRDRVTIGEILTAAGMISSHRLSQALRVAKSAGCPVGRILVMTGDLREQEIQSALQAQALLRQGAINIEHAVRILRVSHRCNISFKDALERQGWQTKNLSNVNELAELLVASKSISNENLDKAISQSAQTNLPLGRILILTGMLPPSVMAAALTALVYLRQKRISKDEAVSGLKHAVAKRISLEQALILEGTYCPLSDCSVKLGELLGIAGLLSENETLHAVETGLEQGKPIGRVLVDFGILSSQLLDAALEVQNLVSTGALTAHQAAYILKYAKHFSINAATAIEHIRRAGIQVAELLRVAGFITDSDLATATSIANVPVLDPAQNLFDSGVIDEHLLSAARNCYRLIWQKVLRSDQAVIVLHYCHRTRVSVEEALEELAWDLPVNANVVQGQWVA